MKRKIGFIVLAVIVIVVVIGYQMVYKQHRQISTEKPEMSTTVAEIIAKYRADPTTAETTYADKTIVVKGQLTSYDIEANTIVVDNQLSAMLQNKNPNIPAPGRPVELKGRFVGYDDLLEELKMDQVSLLNSN